MHLAPEIVHHSASRLREPVIDAGKESENSARRDDVVEMRDDVVSVVQIEIGGIKCQGNPGESADAEHREKGGGEKHGYGKSNRAAPERDEKCTQNDNGRNGNDQGGGLEKCAHRRPHAGEPHVMGPDNEGKKTEDECGEDEGFVTPEWFARIIGKDFGYDAHAGQNQDVNFRVPEKPKQMLP